MQVRRLLVAALLTGFPPGAMAVVPATFDAAVQELGRSWLIDNGGIGLTVGVYVDGQKHFYNFGTTRLDGDRLPTKDTVYEIGGVAKTMAGQLLARAVVEGRAALEDDVTRYLDEKYPNFMRADEPIRLVHLANMTSQLVDNIPDVTQVRPVPGVPLSVTRMAVYDKYTRAEMLRQLHAVAPRAKPGSDPGASNVAAMLLMIALEKIYGAPYDQLLASEIEKPLRMASGTRPDAKQLARGYTKDGEELPTYAAPMSWTTGALRYSAEDLLRYAAWQMAEKDASVKFAHHPTWSTPDKTESIGLYWLTGDSPQGRRVYFSGGTFGFVSVCDLYPDAHVAVVLLANKHTDHAQESLRALSVKMVALARPVSAPDP
jgi:D-alanyl-D-alanine-carboxypeptidase/D-alanyl-D-alanine-endopeptidase